MSFTVLLCTDGSDLATAALEHGLDALRPADRIVIATVIELVDPMLVTGTGMAGGVISASELDTLQRLGIPWGQGYHLARPAEMPPGLRLPALASRGARA